MKNGYGTIAAALLICLLGAGARVQAEECIVPDGQKAIMTMNP